MELTVLTWVKDGGIVALALAGLYYFAFRLVPGSPAPLRRQSAVQKRQGRLFDAALARRDAAQKGVEVKLDGVDTKVDRIGATVEVLVVEVRAAAAKTDAVAGDLKAIAGTTGRIAADVATYLDAVEHDPEAAG